MTEASNANSNEALGRTELPGIDRAAAAAMWEDYRAAFPGPSQRHPSTRPSSSATASSLLTNCLRLLPTARNGPLPPSWWSSPRRVSCSLGSARTGSRVTDGEARGCHPQHRAPHRHLRQRRRGLRVRRGRRRPQPRELAPGALALLGAHPRGRRTRVHAGARGGLRAVQRGLATGTRRLGALR